MTPSVTALGDTHVSDATAYWRSCN